MYLGRTFANGQVAVRRATGVSDACPVVESFFVSYPCGAPCVVHVQLSESPQIQGGFKYAYRHRED